MSDGQLPLDQLVVVSHSQCETIGSTGGSVPLRVRPLDQLVVVSHSQCETIGSTGGSVPLSV